MKAEIQIAVLTFVFTILFGSFTFMFKRIIEKFDALLESVSNNLKEIEKTTASMRVVQERHSVEIENLKRR